MIAGLDGRQQINDLKKVLQFFYPMSDERSGAIELADIQQAVELTERKRLGRKKDRVTIAEDDYSSITASESAVGASSGSRSAAVYTMDGPSIRGKYSDFLWICWLEEPY